MWGSAPPPLVNDRTSRHFVECTFYTSAVCAPSRSQICPLLGACPQGTVQYKQYRQYPVSLWLKKSMLAYFASKNAWGGHVDRQTLPRPHPSTCHWSIGSEVARVGLSTHRERSRRQSTWNITLCPQIENDQQISGPVSGVFQAEV